MIRKSLQAILFLSAAITLMACAAGGKDTTGLSGSSGSDPLNTAYTIEDQAVKLIDGSFEAPAAPGAATMLLVSVIGRPVYGDLDHDGDEDAVVVVVYDSGGSGTFYYIAAAINKKSGFHGTRGYLLGDRIDVQDVAIREQSVIVKYADRHPEEPMNAEPSVDTMIRLVFADGELIPVKQDAAEAQVLEGWVTIGHEVRSFRPCSSKEEHWLMGNSPALEEIRAAYNQALPGAKPYTPLFMSLAGSSTAPPADGFGAGYNAAFLATRLEMVLPEGNCRDEFIVVDSPRPGALITSPLKVRGRARGSWFFEGDFPLVLKDQKGRVIGKSYVTAKGEWMTKEFVPFEGSITFEKPTIGHGGTLVFKKDNPSDRRDLDDAMEYPVYFE
jgi:hypothetical protein